MTPEKRNGTNRKQMEKALREAEEKFSKVFRSSPDAVTIATLSDGIFLEVNDSFTRVTGYTREEVLNRSSVGLGIWVDAEKRNRILQILKKQGSVRNEEFELRIKSGETRIGLFSAEITNFADQPCIIDVVTDITERKRIEVALEESQNFSFSLLENSPNPIEVVNPDTSIQYINPAFEKLTGFTLSEIAGKKIPHPWWPEEAKEEISASFKETMTSGGRRRERIFQKKNGERFWVSIDSAPVMHDGALKYFLINWVDITEHKRADEALQESEEKYRNLIENSKDSISSVDLKGNIQFANKASVTLTGYSLDEGVGMKLRNIIPLKYWPRSLMKFREAQKGKTVPYFETAIKRKDGTIVPVEAGGQAIWKEGKIAGVQVIARDITERKQTEGALRESEEKFSKAFRSSPVSISITTLKGGTFVEVNENFPRFTGYTREEVIGRSSADINIWVNTKDRARMTRMLKEQGRIDNEEFDFRRKSGEIRTWLFSAEKITFGSKPCIIVMTVDVTERKRAEEKLRENERFTSSLLENAPNPIISLNPDTSIRYVNPAFEKLTGFTLDEIAGKKIPHPWWPEEKKKEISASIKKTLSIGGRRLERMFQKKNGELFWVDMKMVPIMHDGILKYHIANWGDITERKQMEEEIMAHRDRLEELVRERTKELTVMNKRLKHELVEREKAEEEMRKARDAADTANQAKSEFLARMSHEIRTPIHGVMGTINLVLESILEKDQRQYLNMSMASAESLLNVINDILDLSKIEAGQIKPECENLDLRATCEETLETMAVSAYKKGLEITCQISSDVPTALVADEGHLRQILINLVGNAIKFTEHGEVAVGVELVADNGSEVELHFTVRDTGIGIPSNIQKIILEPFQQANGSINRKYGGTGLGLTISQRLINQMGGSIWIESKPGKGSTFHFTGKFMKQAPAGYSNNGSKALADIRGLPVLIIDNNATSRMILKSLLGNWGAQITEADSSPTALKVIENTEGTSADFRIILLDKTMLKMDGFAVAERILSNSDLKSAIVMMLPPHDVSDDFARCQELGISNYLIKPIKEAELLKGILTAMGKARDSEEETGQVIPDATDVPCLRILVAEDNATSQLIARKTLEKMGHTVEIANNGSEASRMVEESNFDLVLMDAEMPVMDGLEATRFIRKREKNTGKHIHIIAMTAYAMKEDREKCLEAGMDGYLSKPAKPEEINAVIRNIFSSEEEPAAAPASAPAVVPAFDIDAAMRVFGDDKELLKEAVTLFLEEDYPEQLKLIKDGIERQDASAVKAAAHSIKGAARSLGGLKLGDVAQHLEEVGRDGDLTGASALAEEIEAELKQFTDFFSCSV